MSLMQNYFVKQQNYSQLLSTTIESDSIKNERLCDESNEVYSRESADIISWSFELWLYMSLLHLS